MEFFFFFCNSRRIHCVLFKSKTSARWLLSCGGGEKVLENLNPDPEKSFLHLFVSFPSMAIQILFFKRFLSAWGKETPANSKEFWIKNNEEEKKSRFFFSANNLNRWMMKQPLNELMHCLKFGKKYYSFYY